MAMIEKTECCYVMGVIKGEAMFSLNSNYTLFTKHEMCVHLHKPGFKIIRAGLFETRLSLTQD